MITAGLVGAVGDVRRAIVDALASVASIEILAEGLEERADVLLVAGDERVSAVDRCRELARATSCVLVLPAQPDARLTTEAMRAGARGVVGPPFSSHDVERAIAGAAAFAAPRSEPAAIAPLICVTSGAGGQGCSTVAHAIASLAGGRTLAIDLDLAGGSLARLAGVTVPAGEAGLAADGSPSQAVARLRRRTAYGHVIVAPPRPELAWLVREDLPAQIVAHARERADLVVVDVGRAVGPPLPVLQAASLVVVVGRGDRTSREAVARQARLVRRLGIPPGAIVTCRTDASILTALRSRRGSDIVVPRLRPLAAGEIGPVARRLLGPLAARCAA